MLSSKKYTYKWIIVKINNFIYWLKLEKFVKSKNNVWLFSVWARKNWFLSYMLMSRASFYSDMRYSNEYSLAFAFLFAVDGVQWI